MLRLAAPSFRYGRQAVETTRSVVGSLAPAEQRQPAVDRDVGACDVARPGVAQQHQRHLGDVLRVAGSPQRDARLGQLVLGPLLRRVEIGCRPDPAGGDGVHPDAVRPQLMRQLAAQHRNARLARAVVWALCDEGVVQGRDEQDRPPAVALDQLASQPSGEEQRPTQVGPKDQVELGLLEVEEAMLGADAEIVDDQFHRAVLQDLLRQVGDVGPGDVVGHPVAPGRAVEGAFQGLLVVVDRDHAGLGRDQPVRDGEADATPSSGDDRAPSLDVRWERSGIACSSRHLVPGHQPARRRSSAGSSSSIDEPTTRTKPRFSSERRAMFTLCREPPTMLASSVWVTRRVRGRPSFPEWPGSSASSSSLRASRPGRSRKTSSVASRSARRISAPSDCSTASTTCVSDLSSRISSSLVTTTRIAGSTASAVAERGPPSSSATSPKTAGGQWRTSSTTSPWAERTTSLTAPSASTNSRSPGSSCTKIVCPPSTTRTSVRSATP